MAVHRTGNNAYSIQHGGYGGVGAHNNVAGFVDRSGPEATRIDVANPALAAGFVNPIATPAQEPPPEADLISDGLAAATFDGASIVAAGFTAAGAATVTLESATVVAQPASAVAAAAVAFNGAPILVADVVAAGSGAASINGAPVLGQALNASGVTTVAFDGQAITTSTIVERDIAITGSSLFAIDADNIGIVPQILRGAPAFWERGERRRRKTSREEIEELLADLIAETKPAPETPAPVASHAKPQLRRAIRQALETGRTDELARAAQADLVSALVERTVRRHLDDEETAALLLLNDDDDDDDLVLLLALLAAHLSGQRKDHTHA